jgi:hypothetical protein
VHDVHVKVDSLKFSIRDSKHDFLYKTLKPLATRLVKRQIQKAIRDALHTGLEYVDGQLVAVRDRMETAKKEEDGDGRAEVLKNVIVAFSSLLSFAFHLICELMVIGCDCSCSSGRRTKPQPSRNTVHRTSRLSRISGIRSCRLRVILLGGLIVRRRRTRWRRGVMSGGLKREY